MGPVTVGERTFYAVRGDLLELDTPRGRIIGRTRFPARIIALESPSSPKDASLMVTLGQQAEKVTVRFLLGAPPPGRGPWDLLLLGPAWADAVATVPGYDRSKLEGVSPSARKAAVAKLQRAEMGDRTNPFSPAFRGELLASTDRHEDAAQAFMVAAETPGATWSDLLRLASVLEDANAREPARRAFARGLAGMRAQGLRPHRILAWLPLLLYVPQRALKRAVSSGDVDRVHEVASRLAIPFPRAEYMDTFCDGIAAWMRAHGKADLAAIWIERATIARAGIIGARDQSAALVDRTLPFFLGLTVAAPLVAFAAGLRRGVERLKRRETPGEPGATRWLPRANLVDLVSILFPVCILFVFCLVTFQWVHGMGSYARMPLALQMDGVASPDVEQWVAGLTPSEARERLLEHVRREAQATRAGGRDDRPPPDDVVFIQAAETVPLESRVRNAAILALRLHLFDSPGGWYSPFLLTLVVCVMFVLGGLIGGWSPRPATAVAWFVPGGPGSLGIFGGFVGGLMISAFLALLGADRILRMIALPHRYTLLTRTGLSGDIPLWQPTPNWAYVILPLCLLVHVSAAWTDHVRRRRGQ